MLNTTDTMTPAQRAEAIANGREVDRLPCNPNIANGAARVYGCRISEFNYNPKAIAEAQMAVYRKFGCDSMRIFTDLFTWAEAMGATVTFPDDATADLAKPAISRIEDIDTLCPADPYKDGRLPIHVDAMKYLRDLAKDEIKCSAGIVGPFTNAFFLFGVDKTLKLIHKNPEALHKLCRISLETCKAYAKAALEIGLNPTISEPMSSCTVVSPKVFREFSLPYLKELIDFIDSYNATKVVMHICGQTDKIWRDLADMGIGGMSIDNVASLKDCKRVIGNDVKLLGNVDPSGIMHSGTPLEVRIKTLECILDAYDSPKGYVVMSGCSLPVDTPFDNIQMMMDTVKEVGYPVDVERVIKMLEDCRK
ncbi:methylcobamide:CoM methyltransferase MtbA [Clostridium aceticum]|uniref:Methylcobamide:CoM methyltransferase MtbA n=1 Tax=Clostridium aceticum TaxID=84022 RepID=A0A0D8IC07_9CLOT|nr:uroporphyrinogen decarboxylase family protein [Clostridium aceticum]AKL95688.1 methylcobamide:CoM methyltransferase MtbA [Clostridium aceticum]KJF26756.1 uroporphyrinogen decarboxylase [Clostridium aceticum]